METIRIANITKVYRMGDVEVHALRGVSLTVEKGEFVAIMGASGSGKSTLMNILGCLDRPSGGDFFLEGIDVNGLGRQELAGIRNEKIGFVFQGFNLLPCMTLFENVALSLIYSGVEREECRQCAQEQFIKVGLGSYVASTSNKISGG